MTTRIYFMSEGPDSRHLLYVHHYYNLRDASAHYDLSKSKAKKLHSLDFDPYSNGTNPITRKEQFA